MLEQFVIGLPGKITSTLVANLKKKLFHNVMTSGAAQVQ